MRSQVDIEFFIAITIFAVTLLLATKGITQMIVPKETQLETNCELVLIKPGVGVKCDNEKCIYVGGSVVKFVGNLDECWNGEYRVISSNVTLTESDETICMYGKGVVALTIEGAIYKSADALKFREDGPFVTGC